MLETKEKKLNGVILPRQKTLNEYVRFYCQHAHPDSHAMAYMVSMWNTILAAGGLYDSQAEKAIMYVNAYLVDNNIEEVELYD